MAQQRQEQGRRSQVTLVLGGARSGKSTVAEQLAVRTAVSGQATGAPVTQAAEVAPAAETAAASPVTYLATGVATDADMAARIAAHRERRPATWQTVEVGEDLPGALTRASGTVLVDALGTWLARLDGFRADRAALCDALIQRQGATIVVSDEVGLGVHPSSPAGREFRDALGDLNQAVAAVADEVLLIVAGRVLPLARCG